MAGIVEVVRMPIVWRVVGMEVVASWARSDRIVGTQGSLVGKQAVVQR